MHKYQQELHRFEIATQYLNTDGIGKHTVLSMQIVALKQQLEKAKQLYSD